MAIHQTKLQSDLEKRLTILRRQVYGKQEFRIKEKVTTNSLADITYLYQDLLKIGILSGIAIGAQVILFFLLKNNILRINFI